MSTPQAEIDEEFAPRGENHARSLGRDQRLKMYDVDEPRFNKLGLVGAAPSRGEPARWQRRWSLHAWHGRRP